MMAPSSIVLMFQLLILARLPSSVEKSEAAGYVEELSGVCDCSIENTNMFCVLIAG
jgi:hypothetical protein